MKKLISIISPIYNEFENIDELIFRLKKIEKQLTNKYNFEYIFINDGSKDNSLTKLEEYEKKYNNIKIINFFKNFGQQIAFKTGYDQANGDYIITMDSDLQDPPELILELIQKIEKNENLEIIYTKKIKRHDGFFKKITAKIYYKIINKLSNKIIPENVGDFRLITKKILEQIKNIKKSNIYLRGILAFFSDKYDFINFDRPNRTKGKTKYNIFKMLKLGINGFLTIPNIKNKFFNFIIKLTIFLTILPFFILCFFNQPSAADDFCFAFDRKTENIINITKRYYNTWSFRYSEGILHYLNPMIYSDNINLYKIITPTFLIILIYAFYFFIKKLLNLNKSKTLIISLIFFNTYLLFMPSIAEGLYWFSGSFAIYQTGIILILFLIGIIINFLKEYNKIDIIKISFILIALAGISEIFIFTILPLLFFIFVYLFIKNNNKKWIFFYFFILFFIFSIISITAPGNFIRQSLLTEKSFSEELLFKIKYSIIAIKKYPLKWTNIITTILSLIFLVFLSKQNHIKQKHINPLLILFISIFLMFFGFFIIQWPNIADRNLNVFYFIFLLLTLINIFNFSNYLKNKNLVKNKTNKNINKIKTICFLLIIFSIIITNNNTKQAYRDIFSKSAQKYNKELIDRYNFIKNNKEKNLVINNIKNKPKSIYFLDITKSKNDFKNKCYASFFNLESIIIK